MAERVEEEKGEVTSGATAQTVFDEAQVSGARAAHLLAWFLLATGGTVTLGI